MYKPNQLIVILGLCIGFLLGFIANRGDEHRCQEKDYKAAYLNYIEKIDSTTIKIK